MDDNDRKWINALKPYVGGGIVPYFRQADGTVDAAKTLDSFMRLAGVKKIGPNGEYIEW